MKTINFATAEELKKMTPEELYDYFAQQTAEPMSWYREDNDNYYEDNHPYQTLRKLIYKKTNNNTLVQDLFVRRVYKNHCAPTFRKPKEDTIKTHITVRQYEDTLTNDNIPIVDIVCDGFVF